MIKVVCEPVDMPEEEREAKIIEAFKILIESSNRTPFAPHNTAREEK